MFGAKGGASSAVREQDLLQSGGHGLPASSARAGYLPIALERVPLGALKGVGVHLRIRSGQEALALGIQGDFTGYPLYCAETVAFEEKHRQRLLEFGVKFIYIKIADQAQFKAQAQELIAAVADDSSVAISERSTLVYETSVELMNELLAEPALGAKSPRLEQVSRAITSLVINDPGAFSHLYVASHHDFYTATHMVNVATWMVPLAYELGHRDPDELNHICQAGLLHDMGKTEVPAEVLNKSGNLTDDEWRQIRMHPEAGYRYLSKFADMSPLIATVAYEHHERIDGTGYPRGLKGFETHPVSRICAVVDSFDAMTAFRPFKTRTLSVPEALKILRSESGSKYEPAVVDAWLQLMQRAEEAAPTIIDQMRVPAPSRPRRRHRRQTFHCEGRLHVIAPSPKGPHEGPAIRIVAHNISQSGLGFVCREPLVPGEMVHVYLRARGWVRRCLGGQVIRCCTHDDAWSEVGIEFTTLEAESSIKVLTVSTSRS